MKFPLLWVFKTASTCFHSINLFVPSFKDAFVSFLSIFISTIAHSCISSIHTEFRRRRSLVEKCRVFLIDVLLFFIVNHAATISLNGSILKQAFYCLEICNFYERRILHNLVEIKSSFCAKETVKDE